MKMTLNKTWKECLRMWKDITTLPEYEGMDIDDAKDLWLDSNGYKDVYLKDTCFFCNYIWEGGLGCGDCPGRLVAPRFNCCNKPYSYKYEPKKFYKKLLRLDAKRKMKGE